MRDLETAREKSHLAVEQVREFSLWGFFEGDKQLPVFHPWAEGRDVAYRGVESLAQLCISCKRGQSLPSRRVGRSREPSESLLLQPNAAQAKYNLLCKSWQNKPAFWGSQPSCHRISHEHTRPLPIPRHMRKVGNLPLCSQPSPCQGHGHCFPQKCKLAFTLLCILFIQGFTISKTSPN